MASFLRHPIFRFALFVSTLALGFCFTLGIRLVAGLKSLSDPIQVRLAPMESDSQMESLTLKIQWGGFYATRVGDSYRIFRLLDLTPNSCNIVTYSEVFPEVPSINEVSFLVPENEHVQLQGTAFLSMKPILFGARRLKPIELVKFNVDLQSSPRTGQDVAARTARVINLSNDPPLESRLSSVQGQLHFEQPGY